MDDLIERLTRDTLLRHGQIHYLCNCGHPECTALLLKDIRRGADIARKLTGCEVVVERRWKYDGSFVASVSVTLNPVDPPHSPPDGF